MRSLHSLILLLALGGCASQVAGEPRLSFDGTDPVAAHDGVALAQNQFPGAASNAVDQRIEDDEPYYHGERTYAVVMVEEGDVLNVRDGAGVDHPIIGTLAPESVELTATGREEMVGTSRWVEILLPIEGQGWVNSYYLTELVAPAHFCEDTGVSDLLTELELAIREQNGERLFGVVSPRHGLTVQVLPNGNRHRFDDTDVRGLFQSDESFDWGTHPYTGEQHTGTFFEEVATDLEATIAGANAVVQCNDLVLGGHAYDVRLAPSLANFNFYTLHFPGSDEYSNMDWSTWMVGVEYSEGVPYVVSLVHFSR